MIGVMLCGAYAKLPDGSEDDFLYTGYNFHWETRNIALPQFARGDGVEESDGYRRSDL